MKVLSRRLSRVSDRLDTKPDPTFLAYARSVIAWGGHVPIEADVRVLADELAAGRSRPDAP